MLMRLRQKDHEFKARWGYIVKPYLKMKNKQKQQKKISYFVSNDLL
jgi:hypothetical protein